MSEPILRIHRQGPFDRNRQIILQDIINMMGNTPQSFVVDPTHVATNCMFEVYTTTEVSQIVADSEGRINQELNKIKQDNNESIINQRINLAKTELKNEIGAKIDALPQRLLTDTAKQEIKELIMTDVRQMLSALKSELENKIREINHP